jgi:hypothetical protein
MCISSPPTGCEGEVRVFSSSGRTLRSVWSLPHGGDVTCMVGTGIGTVWIGVRNRRGKGSLYLWDFAE